MFANLARRKDELHVVSVADVVADVIVVESAVVDKVPPSHSERLQKGDEM